LIFYLKVHNSYLLSYNWQTLAFVILISLIDSQSIEVLRRINMFWVRKLSVKLKLLADFLNKILNFYMELFFPQTDMRMNKIPIIEHVL